MNTQDKNPKFLEGGGEMGRIIRSYPWSETWIGAVSGWPQSLRATLGIVLHSAFPMFLFWGKELTCFYNDAFRPSLGIDGKHPAIGKTGREVWSEIWSFIGPLIEQVMSSGESVYFEDQLVPFYRNGKIEDIYWTFSYSPAYGDDGLINGVFVTCTETTKKVLNAKLLEQSLANVHNIFLQAPVAVCIFTGPQHVVKIANNRMLELWGTRSENVIDKPIFEGLPEAGNQGFEELLNNVYATGQTFTAQGLPITLPRKSGLETVYVNFVYEAFREGDGSISGVMAVATEVTEQVVATKKIEESEKAFRQLADSLPEMVWTTDHSGAQTFASGRWKEFTGLDPYNEETFTAMVHPDDYTSITNKWKDSLTSGQPYETEVRLRSRNGAYYWFRVKGEPISDEQGNIEKWIGTFSNINERKISEQKLLEAFQAVEESEKRFRNIAEKLNIVIEASELGTWEWDILTDEIQYSDLYAEIFGHKKNDSSGHHRFLEQLHPDDREKRNKAIEEAQANGFLHHQMRILWDDGSLHWVEVKGKIFYQEGQKPVKLIGTLRDVTEDRDNQHEQEERERKFRLLADSMPQFVWTGDAGGNLNYFNQSVFDYTGLSSKNIDEGGWLQIVHPDDREENTRRWIESVRTGKDFLFEHRFRRHDGEYRWQLSRAIPQKDAAGNIRMWVGTSTDVQDQKLFAKKLEEQVADRTRELKKINDALSQSEERYHLMVSEVQDYAILYLDRQGTIQNWNKGAEHIKGYKAQEIVGKHFSIFYTETDRQNRLPEKLLQEAMQQGKAWHEGWRTRKDKSLFWGNVVITALRNERGEILGFSKVTRDLTEKKAADDRLKSNAQQLEQKNKELQKMNDELESFAYVSSHDLQEPLRKIQTFASMILERDRSNLSDSGKEYFDRIRHAANRMQLLIEDLLSYSRTSSVEGILEYTDLNTIFDDVKNELKESLEERHAVIETNGLCKVNIIPFQFRQMMLNLISNSLKFSKPGTIPHITVSGEIEKAHCHLTVSDNGIGFDPQYSDRIFEVFQRLHGREEYKGTGIGLSIVKKIVENHGGSIKATGKLGEGARFDIYLPI